MTADPAIAALIPHTGLMCLLERIVRWDDASLVATTGTHRRSDHPLLRAGLLDPVVLCEYGAQAMAVHGGLLASREGRRAPPGLLVSLRDAWLGGGDLRDCRGDLEVVATRLFGDGNGWQYEFRVAHEGRALASGRVAVVLRHE
jgi:predicted hotdog family 3-hydroxylacyl-ACP dehydratase